MGVGEASSIEGDDRLSTDLFAGDHNLVVRDDVKLREVGKEGEKEDVEDKNTGMEGGRGDEGEEGAEAGLEFKPRPLEDIDRGHRAADKDPQIKTRVREGDITPA